MEKKKPLNRSAFLTFNTMKHITRTREETLNLGYKLGKKIKPGSIIALVGDLGTGKTIFTKGIAKALGVKDYEYVNSPSFVLLKEYRPTRRTSQKTPLYHFDLYRLDSSLDLESVGYEEYFYSKGISVVEWADRAMDILPYKYILVKFKHLGETKREITDSKVKVRKRRKK